MVPLSGAYFSLWCAIGHHTMKSGARYDAAFSRRTMADFRRCAFEHHNRLCGMQFSTTQPKVARVSTPLVESIQQLIIRSKVLDNLQDLTIKEMACIPLPGGSRHQHIQFLYVHPHRWRIILSVQFLSQCLYFREFLKSTGYDALSARDCLLNRRCRYQNTV